MKYYSEILKKHFDTEEQCLAEEETFRQQQEIRKNTKAKLAKDIEDASKEVDIAYKQLDEAKQEVEKLQQEYNDKVDAIMNPVKDRLQECLDNKRKAIEEFNKHYGPYTTVYKGDDAFKEWFRTVNNIDKLFKHFWL